MSATTDIRMINLQVMAETAMKADKAAGTYDANVASDSKYYLWQSQFQTRPMGMEDKPEAYAQLLRQSLPEVTTLRIPFNAYSFNADGSLDPMFERFLTAAAAQGFDFLFVYADGDMQRLGENDGLGLDAIRAGLAGQAHDRMIDGWGKMLDWLDGHADVRNAVYAFEAVNEPAAYARAETLGGETGEFVRLYGDHMAALAQFLDARSDVPLMVGGWAYSALFDVLAQTTSSDGQTSVLDQIRAAVGEDLIWSAHLYPDWAAGAGQDIQGMVDFIADRFGVLGDDDIVVTETNLDPGSGMSFWMARAYEAFADAGIGIGWFAGADYGRSTFVNILNGRHVNFMHPDILAQGMNAFLLGEPDPAHAASEAVTAALLAGNVYDDNGVRLALNGMGFAAGHDGNDTLTGIEQTINMLYGGRGDDVLNGTSGRDHLFGQADNDTLLGGAGSDVLMGGDGDDLLSGGGGNDVLTGGRGSDHFVLEAETGNTVTDLRLDQGDSLTMAGRLWTAAELLAAGTLVDHDGDGLADDLVVGDGASRSIFLNMRRPDGIVQATDLNDHVTVGYADIEGDKFTWEGAWVAGLGGNDTLTGSIAADTLDGGAGDDVIAGRTGDDVLIGGEGNDALTGEGGHDVIAGGNGSDTITGNADNDSLRGGLGNDIIDGGDGNDFLAGEADNDSLTGGGGNDTILGGIGADTIRGGYGDETISGEEGDDYIDGNGDDDAINGGVGNDTLIGSGGNDTLDGGGGGDAMAGGSGDDIYLVESAGDRVSESGNGGTDTVISAIGHVLGANVENLTLAADSGSIAGTGNSLANSITGNGGYNVIDGASGNDTIDGGDGNDTLTGGVGNDFLLGDGGKDRLTGGAGTDSLSGGAGADVFVFLALSDSTAGEGRDRITWFKHTQGDRIDLGAIDARTDLAGNDAFAFIGSSAFSGTAGQLSVRAVQGGTLIAADVDGNRVSDFEILIEDAAAINADSFLF
ncbi:calcium-binding protein [Paracoccus shandongensis]|uniref:calcium-binding protein n=1 Tax=Paracoccus shandongensis TaxID=2816048 RepID=UPI001A8F6A16|nr:calcium-binding protein [Paracoccus shandongensis]